MDALAGEILAESHALASPEVAGQSPRRPARTQAPCELSATDPRGEVNVAMSSGPPCCTLAPCNPMASHARWTCAPSGADAANEVRVTPEARMRSVGCGPAHWMRAGTAPWQSRAPRLVHFVARCE